MRALNNDPLVSVPKMEFLNALLCVGVVFFKLVLTCERSLMAGTIHAHERDSADTPREERAEN